MSRLLLALVLCFLSHTAIAQQLQQVLPRPGDSSEYYYFKIACSDERNCTIPAMRFDLVDRMYHAVLERTTDGGLSWTQQESPFLPQLFYTQDEWNGAVAIDSLHVVAYGDSGMIAMTSDGGANWLDVSIRDYRDFVAGSQADGHIMLVGGGGVASISSDAGATWKVLDMLPFNAFTGVKVFNATEISAYPRGAGPIYTTMDGWQTLDSSSKLYDPKSFHPDSIRTIGDLFWVDRDTIIGFGGATDKRPGHSPPYVKYPYIVRSTNAGSTWEVVFERPSMLSQLRSFAMNDEGFGIAAGIGPNYLFTRDYGATWSEDSIRDSIGYSEISDITFLNNTTALMDFSVSNFGKIYRVSFDQLGVEAPGSKIRSGTTIFPNPSSGIVSLQKWYTYDQDVRIVDIFGRVVMTTKIDREPGTSKIDCTDLPNGTYTILLKHEGSDLPVGRFVLMK